MTPRERLKALCGEGPVGVAWLGIPSPVPARIAAGRGIGAGVVDCEHGAIGIETAAEMVAALKSRVAAALVRVPEITKTHIGQVLDAGADGLVLPQIESAGQAAEAVRLALYPPDGARGAALGVIAASGYGADPDHGAMWNRRVLLAAQIESCAGLAAAPEIASISGISMLFFGPYDYAADAGLDPAKDTAALREAFDAVVAAARASGTLAGVFPWPGAAPAELVAAGADMVAVASDVVALGQAFSDAAKVLA